MDNHCDLLLLRLNCLILAEVLGILCPVSFENLTLVKGSRVHLHELFNGIELVLHSHTVTHDLLFSLAEFLKLIELIFDCLDSWVLVDLASIGGLWDH